MMPELTETTLVSAAKLAEAGYVSIFDDDEVNVYDTYNTVITVSRSEVLRGYKCPQSGLWRTPLTKNPITKMTNLNTETVIYRPDRQIPYQVQQRISVHNGTG